jgi:hypothetical protein
MFTDDEFQVNNVVEAGVPILLTPPEATCLEAEAVEVGLRGTYYDTDGTPIELRDVVQKSAFSRAEANRIDEEIIETATAWGWYKPRLIKRYDLEPHEYIKDYLVGKEVILPGTHITLLDADCGSGKTSFALNYVVNELKNPCRILYLSNRSALKEDIINQLDTMKLNRITPYIKDTVEYRTPSGGSITVMNYQHLDNVLQKHMDGDVNLPNLQLPHYDYIVFDEVHCLVSDVTFIHSAPRVLDYLVETGSQILFMTATPLEFRLYFTLAYRGKGFDTEYQFRKPLPIGSVYYFDNLYTIEHLLSTLQPNEAAIAFIHSAKLAYEMHKRLNDSTFVCSRYIQDKVLRKHNDIVTLNKIISQNTFDYKILLTTKALDNGISIRSTANRIIKYIIIDLYGPTDVMQCLGRFRYDPRFPKPDVFIRRLSKHELQDKAKGLERSIQVICDKHKLDDVSFRHLYEYEDFKGLLRHTTNDKGEAALEINYIMESKIRHEYELLSEMLKYNYNNDGYLKVLCEYIPIKYDSMIYFDRPHVLSVVDTVLAKHVGIKLTADKHIQELQEILDALNACRNPKEPIKPKSHRKTINNYLESFGSQYQIDVNPGHSGSSRYWKFISI